MELKITNLSMEFGSLKAVDSISCSLTGGVYGLLGVNGAGKTTLMRMLTTLMRPSSGCITWDGQDYLDSIREPKVWERIKKTLAGTVGSTTLDVVRQTGSMVALAMVREGLGM